MKETFHILEKRAFYEFLKCSNLKYLNALELTEHLLLVKKLTNYL